MSRRRFVDSGASEKLWEYEGPEPVGNRIGVAFSGGGIRSAAFSLGALQVLQERGLMGRVHYLSAVSGGSYTAAAYLSTLVRSGKEALDSESDSTPRPPWSPGSPEERYLMRNLGYLARGFQGRVWFVANALFGIVMNLLPLLFGSFIVGRVLGATLYRKTHPGLGHGDVRGQLLAASVLACLVLVLCLILTVLWRRTSDDDDTRDEVQANNRHMAWAGGFAIAFLVVLVVGVVLPAAAAGVHVIIDRLGIVKGDLEGPQWVAERLAICFGLTAVSLLLGASAVLILRTGRVRWLAFLLSSISGPVLLLAPCVLAIESSAVRGWDASRDLSMLAASVCVPVFFGFFVHNRSYSMHNFYRERLSEAFFVERHVLGGEGGRGMRTSMTPYSRRILLSDQESGKDRAGRPIPELLIGAAVNASDKTIGFGSGAAQFVFGPRKSGSVELGWTDTDLLSSSQRHGGSDLTLPAMVAISGAALSPVMGRLTLTSFRFLLALLNVRLGVWVPRPTDLRRAQEGPLARRLQKLDELLSRARVYDSLKRGWLEPGALYVLREGLGRTSLNSRFVYVTDGGHWENLGLYELARRRCTHIVVFDASNNPQSPLADFGRCCQLMFSRLGITVRLEPSTWESLDANDPDVESPIAVGEIEYPDAPPGVLIYCRSALWKGAPPELSQYARTEPRFPRHSTGNQFLTADQFDAYRRLGWETGGFAADELEPILDVELDEGRESHPPEEDQLRFAVVG